MAFALACAFAAGPALAQDGALGTNVQGLLEHARAQNPELAAMRLEAEAAAQRVQPAGALPDPVLRVELMNVNNYGNDAGFNLLPSRVGETKYTLMQMLPAWGKRDLRRDVADADVRQAHGAQRRRPGPSWPCASRPATRATTSRRNNERLTREILGPHGHASSRSRRRATPAGWWRSRTRSARSSSRPTMRSELIMLDSREAPGARAAERAAGARRGGAAGRTRRAAPAAAPSARWTRRRSRSGARQNNPQLQAEDARLRGAEKNRELAQPQPLPGRDAWAFRRARWARASRPGA